MATSRTMTTDSQAQERESDGEEDTGIMVSVHPEGSDTGDQINGIEETHNSRPPRPHAAAKAFR